MIVTKERTRLIFTEFNESEKKYLEDMVASMDNVFMYIDPDGEKLGMPTGMEARIKKAFPKAKFIDKSNEYWPYAKIQPVEHNAQPRNQLQIDFINFVLKESKSGNKLAGILSPGTGKTFMACYSALNLGLRTMIIVPTSSIKKQWADTLTGMFKVPNDRVKMVMKPKDFINIKEDFVVVSQASLAVLNKTYDLERIIKDNRFGIKVIDECQMWYKNIVNVDANCNIFNNWYLTGTFGRSGDDENKLYQEMFGDLAVFREKDKKPTIFNPKPGNVYGMKPYIHVEMIWMHSGLSKEEIASVTSSMRYSEREGKWMRFGISVPAYTELVIPSDGHMTKFLKTSLEVIRKADKRSKDGRMLVLCPTIASSDVVADYCSRMFPDKKIDTINSKHSGAENDQIKRECDIVVSTVASAGTGFDMKGLRKLVVLSPFRSWILADQVSGRLRRNKDEKGNDIECYMYDIIDADLRQLRIWGNTRGDVLKRKSKTFKVVDM